MNEFPAIKQRDMVVDVDDLVSEEQLALFDEIRAVRPDFHVTLYGIPNKLGPVWHLCDKYPWVTFAQHGFEHTHFECLTWTQDEATRLLTLGRDMGYAPIFKAPNWELDVETELACKAMGVLLHHHEGKIPITPGLRTYPGPARYRTQQYLQLHSHISPNASTDWIGQHPGFQSSHFGHVGHFLSVPAVSVVLPELEKP